MDESSLRYICLLNHSDLDMFVLVTIGPEGLVQVCIHSLMYQVIHLNAHLFSISIYSPGSSFSVAQSVD